MMIEAAIVPSTIKALYSLYAKGGSSNHFLNAETAIIDLLIIIGDCCLKSMGHINVFVVFLDNFEIFFLDFF